MTNKLETIFLRKKQEVANLKCMIHQQSKHPIAQILRGKLRPVSKKSFKSALRKTTLAIIAEIKRRSPSKGHLAPIPDATLLAKQYIESGANALSVLTDETFFSGHLNDLIQVSQALCEDPHPILRKDFIIDEIQIAEAVAANADAILCIVAMLKNKTKILLQHAKAMGIEVLVEIHNLEELDIALESDADIIGVNNRNLDTLQVNTNNAFELLDHIPKEKIRVAESGILEPALAQEYYQAGFDAILVGEALVKSNNPIDFIKACRNESTVN